MSPPPHTHMCMPPTCTKYILALMPFSAATSLHLITYSFTFLKATWGKREGHTHEDCCWLLFQRREGEGRASAGAAAGHASLRGQDGKAYSSLAAAPHPHMPTPHAPLFPRLVHMPTPGDPPSDPPRDPASDTTLTASAWLFKFIVTPASMTCITRQCIIIIITHHAQAPAAATIQ